MYKPIVKTYPACIMIENIIEKIAQIFLWLLICEKIIEKIFETVLSNTN